jgi:hypothetical protein
MWGIACMVSAAFPDFIAPDHPRKKMLLLASLSEARFLFAYNPQTLFLVE